MSRQNLYALVTAILLLLAGPAGSVAQMTPTAVAAEPGSELTVYVMTMGPGELVWERFGHNALWIHDAADGTDIAYNWGLFSFEQEDFILRFMRGEMDYWMEGIDAGMTADHYIRYDRSIWVQELNLTPSQRAELRDFVKWNSLPDNRIYRYDYYRDNCSTRVRDAIDRVLGGQLQAQTDSAPIGTSYRERTRESVDEAPLLFTVMMLGTGSPVDRELTAWEDMFMPLSMMERIRDVTIEGPTGERVPLVLSERQVYASASLTSEPAEGPPIWIYLLIGTAVSAAVVAAARASERRRGARTTFRILTILWGAVAGILGTVLVLLWALTEHQAAYANENLFFFNPLLLILAVVLPFAVSLRGRGRLAAFRVAVVVAGLSLLGFALQLLPGLDQENGELIALALPINLALAYAAWLFQSRGEGIPVRTPSGSGTVDTFLPNPA